MAYLIFVLFYVAIHIVATDSSLISQEANYTPQLLQDSLYALLDLYHS